MKWRSLDETTAQTEDRSLHEIYAERKELIAKYVPAVPGCNTTGTRQIPQPAGGVVAPTLNLGSTVFATHGTITSVCKDFPCLIGNQYLVGVMGGTSCGVPINSTQTITGFATVKILGTRCNGSASGDAPSSSCSTCLKVQAQFIDCAKPENAPICSAQLTSECPGCGTGQVVMVE